MKKKESAAVTYQLLGDYEMRKCCTAIFRNKNKQTHYKNIKLCSNTLANFRCLIQILGSNPFIL